MATTAAPVAPATPGLVLPRQQGLTLIELVIVLAVLAVLSALVWPSVSARMERQRLLTAAQLLAADLTEARFEAARRNGTMHVAAEPGAQWCWVVAQGRACGCAGPTPDAAAELPTPNPTPARAAADSGATAGPSCAIRTVRRAEHPGVLMNEGQAVTLEPTGQAVPGTVATLSSPRGEQLRVRLSPLGRASVCAVGSGWRDLPVC